MQNTQKSVTQDDSRRGNFSSLFINHHTSQMSEADTKEGVHRVRSSSFNASAREKLKDSRYCRVLMSAGREEFEEIHAPLQK